MAFFQPPLILSRALTQARRSELDERELPIAAPQDPTRPTIQSPHQPTRPPSRYLGMQRARTRSAIQRTRGISRWTLAIGWGLGLASCMLVPGCGTTKSVTATEQLLMSDAVDSTIAKMDFRPLTGYKIFLDTTYVTPAGKAIPGVPMQFNLVNSDYVISALRQQITAAGCMLVDNKDIAEIICEARCGALGTDGHNVTYGIPASNLLSSASSMIAAGPQLPMIPEISFAKREMKSAAAKIAVFAYDRESREPLWQSGIAQAGSSARDTWLMGIGPIQYGTIYNGTRFAGKRVGKKNLVSDDSTIAQTSNGIDHRTQHVFASQLFAGKDDSSHLAAEEADNNSATPESAGPSSQGVQATRPGDTIRR
jgi:hypothetical protein